MSFKINFPDNQFEQSIYIFMVDWLGLAGLSRLWIKTDGFSSLHALMLQTLPPLSRVKHSD